MQDPDPALRFFAVSSKEQSCLVACYRRDAVAERARGTVAGRRSPRPAHPAVLNRRGFVEAPTLPSGPWIRLPPALLRRYDDKEMKVSHPHPANNSASWRTICIDPRIAGEFGWFTHGWPRWP